MLKPSLAIRSVVVLSFRLNLFAFYLLLICAEGLS